MHVADLPKNLVDGVASAVASAVDGTMSIRIPEGVHVVAFDEFKMVQLRRGPAIAACGVVIASNTVALNTRVSHLFMSQPDLDAFMRAVNDEYLGQRIAATQPVPLLASPKIARVVAKNIPAANGGTFTRVTFQDPATEFKSEDIEAKYETERAAKLAAADKRKAEYLAQKEEIEKLIEKQQSIGLSVGNEPVEMIRNTEKLERLLDTIEAKRAAESSEVTAIKNNRSQIERRVAAIDMGDDEK